MRRSEREVMAEQDKAIAQLAQGIHATCYRALVDAADEIWQSMLRYGRPDAVNGHALNCGCIYCN